MKTRDAVFDNLRSMRDPSPFDVLGLGKSATREQVLAARRNLAKTSHPDRGGTTSQMGAINAAVRDALKIIDERTHATEVGAEPRRDRGRHERQRYPRGMMVDHPSFVIDELPVVAFEALMIAVNALGEISDDDPPYRLQAILVDPESCWCEIELLPEAGSTNVGLAVAQISTGSEHRPAVGYDLVEDVRDALIAELNRLDWQTLSP